MDNIELEKSTGLEDVLGGMLDSYAHRDTGIKFPDWLTEQLGQRLPNMTGELRENVFDEIAAGIDGYHQARAQLDAAIARGQAKEAWLAEQLASAYAEMSPDEAGEKLRQIKSSVMSSNMQFLGRSDSVHTEIEDFNAEAMGWNPYRLKNEAYEIGNQAALLGEAAAVTAMANLAKNGGGTDDIIGAVLRNALKENKSEVEAVVAVAVKAAADLGLDGMAPVPAEVIGNIAGAAVDGAEALIDFACGKIEGLEAVDRIGRGGVVVGCCIGRNMLKGYLLSIPAVGPVLVDLFGGLLDHMASATFQNNVYNVVHDAAVATWEGMKEAVAADRQFKQLENAQVN